MISFLRAGCFYYETQNIDVWPYKAAAFLLESSHSHQLFVFESSWIFWSATERPEPTDVRILVLCKKMYNDFNLHSVRQKTKKRTKKWEVVQYWRIEKNAYRQDFFSFNWLSTQFLFWKMTTTTRSSSSSSSDGIVLGDTRATVFGCFESFHIQIIHLVSSVFLTPPCVVIFISQIIFTCHPNLAS